MRTGNSFSVMGDLIDELQLRDVPGQPLRHHGRDVATSTRDRAPNIVIWYMKLRDPGRREQLAVHLRQHVAGANRHGHVPTNEPVLSHVDVIRGDITGEIYPSDQPEYETNVSNPTTEIFATHRRADAGEFTVDGEFLVASQTTIPTASTSPTTCTSACAAPTCRSRYSERDRTIDGNPLLDDYSSLIPCTADDGVGPLAVLADATGGAVAEVAREQRVQFDPSVCPDHLPVDSTGQKFLDADVEAWTDLWFYANPIFVDVRKRRGEREDD